MERRVLDSQEIELRLDDDFNAILNMIGEGAPVYTTYKEFKIEKERQREEEKDLH
ncbi:hypothetical protein ACQKDB_14585 [Planococcus kocurii]|uniref:hypothetical protein n=1 Tax=Planococcus TaxID=1372 RepID=UPI00165D570E|nr:hypothetical protein [Planococcus sp. ANT_H30]